jgi:hypothetical protein
LLHARNFTSDNSRLLLHISLENVYNREQFKEAMRCLQGHAPFKRIEFDENAICRFEAEDMAEDLLYLAYQLWQHDRYDHETGEEKEEEDCTTMEEIVDVFCFWDYGEISEEGEYGYEPTWGKVGKYYHNEEKVVNAFWDRFPGEEGEEELMYEWSEDGKGRWRHPWNVRVRQLLLRGMRRLSESYY